MIATVFYSLTGKSILSDGKNGKRSIPRSRKGR
jgi:hypothetical protein